MLSPDSIIYGMNQTPSTSNRETPVKNKENKAKKRKSNSLDENFLKSATAALQNVSSVLTKKSEDKENRNCDDHVDVFLKFIGVKLRKIKNIRIYEDAEVDIINVVNNAYNLEKNLDSE